MKIQRIAIMTLACIAIAYFLFAVRPLQSHSSSFERMKRFSRIGNAIENYSYEHNGELPARLSDIYPKYIGTNGLSAFYPPDLKNLPPDWNAKPELINNFSDCVYLGTSGVPHEVIAYQRENNRNTNGQRLNIIFPHGGGTTITKEELDELLKTNNCTLLEYFRKEQVMSYEANLHASLNSYRIDYGNYPSGNNAAVTRVLRGDNPKKEQYHSSYIQERNSNGEDLDPWGTPYLIQSDGNRVQIKSAGRNQKFDEVGSTNYDDICFSLANGSLVGIDTKF